MSERIQLAMPAHVMLDDAVPIRCSGLVPGRRVTISTRTTVGDQDWRGLGTFVADPLGVVDPAHTPSLGGTYRGHRRMGLFWSQVCTTGASVFPATAQQVRTAVTVRQGDAAAGAEVARVSLPARCTARAVRDHGLVGTLFHPRERTGRPVLVLGGSEGGQPDLVAALLAAHGYAALALTYFGAAGLPDALRRVPVDYFLAAVDWLAGQPESRGGRVAIHGNSKGGEAALLVGSLSDRVAGVAAMVPSGVVTPAQTGDGPSWVWRGDGLPPPLPGCRPPEVGPGETVVLADGYPSLYDVDGRHRSAIAVERIAGPVLIVSAGDDAVWPAHLAEVSADRLRRAGRDGSDRVVRLPRAGHLVQPPYLPTTPRLIDHAGGAMLLGGSPGANARGAVRAWRASLDLLRRTWPTDAGYSSTVP